MGWLSALGKIGGIAGGIVGAPFTGGASLLPSILGAAGAGLGAISQGQAQNRGEQFGGQMDLEKLLLEREQQLQQQQIAREQEGRTSGNDAWKRLLMAQHTIDPGARPQLSPYSVAPRQSTGAELQGADAMTQEVMKRLQGGNPIPAVTQHQSVVDPSLLKSGWLEKLTGYGGAGLSAYANLRRPQPSVMYGGFAG